MVLKPTSTLKRLGGEGTLVSTCQILRSDLWLQERWEVEQSRVTMGLLPSEVQTGHGAAAQWDWVTMETAAQ